MNLLTLRIRMNNPDLQKWLLAPDGIATRLRTLRGATTGKAFAEAAGMRATKLSKLELGQQEPTADDIRAIVAAAEQSSQVADELVAKLSEMPTVKISARVNRFGQVATQKRLNQLLAQSTMVQMFEAAYLPRPMQTVDYATTVLQAAARARGIKSEAEQAAVVLTTGQELLLQRRRRFEIVVAEPVLRWQVLPPAAMRLQLALLLDYATLPNVDLRILAMGRQNIVPPPTGFGLLEETGYIDSLEGAEELTGDRLGGHRDLMEDLMSKAVSGSEAIALIRAAVNRMQSAITSVNFDDGNRS